MLAWSLNWKLSSSPNDFKYFKSNKNMSSENEPNRTKTSLVISLIYNSILYITHFLYIHLCICLYDKSKRMYKPASSEKSLVVNPHIFPRLYEFILFVDHKRRCLAQCSCCSFSFSDSRQWPGAVILQRGSNHHKSINYEHIPSHLRACFEKRAKFKSFLRDIFSVQQLKLGCIAEVYMKCTAVKCSFNIRWMWKAGKCHLSICAISVVLICSYNCLCLYVIFYTGFVY